ncbi:TPA: DUF4440 domain-containing protein [Serratia marcescens]|nr:DUF4440 domain-containing protein [Serratia marcescens]
MPAMKPEECDLLMAQAFKNKNIDDVLSLFEQNGVLILPGNAVAIGHIAIAEALEKYMEAKDFKLIREPVVFFSACQDIAFTRTSWSAWVKDADGPLNEVTGESITIVRRQPDGTWLLVINHPNGAD